MPTPTIAIIGAGLSGLVCARILQIHGVAVTVYEMDPSAKSRQQGGSLDIHHDTGQIAVKEAGLYDEFLRNTHPGGEAMRVLDKNAHVFIDEKEPEGGNGRPEIDRTTLRQLFIDALEPGTIEWGSKLVAVRPAETGHELEFASGRTVRADLVVGADGAWSKVRAALTAVRPEYTGITMVELRLPDATINHPDALAIVGQGSLFAVSDNKYIGGHGGDQIALGLGLRVADDWIIASGIDWNDPVATREALLREFADWATPLTDMIRECNDAIWPRPIYALPTGHTWKRMPGITLVGDAAHLMSPFAVEGANLAMIDGADLARALLADGSLVAASLGNGRITAGNFDAALESYEKKMFPRGAKSAKQSANGLAMIFNAEAPKKLVSFFRRMGILSRAARLVGIGKGR